MAWTAADLAALDAALATGTLTVTFADRSVTYHSLEELLTLRAVMASQVEAATRQRFRLAAVAKGV